MTAALAAARAPLGHEDRVPHSRAVWRAYASVLQDGERPVEAVNHAVAIEYVSGLIWQGYGYDADWRGARRWRFGWAPAR